MKRTTKRVTRHGQRAPGKTRVHVWIDAHLKDEATLLGNGNLAHGITLALILAKDHNQQKLDTTDTLTTTLRAPWTEAKRYAYSDIHNLRWIQGRLNTDDLTLTTTILRQLKATP